MGKKRDDEDQWLKDFAKGLKEADKKLAASDGRNVVGVNKGVVISADVIEGGINFQA